MSQSPVALSLGPAPHPAGMPGGGESSCVKIPELERSSRSRKFRATFPAPQPAGSPLPLPRAPERPEPPHAPPRAPLRRDPAALGGEQSRGCASAEPPAVQPAAACPRPCADWRGAWPSSLGPGEGRAARSHQPREAGAGGPTQSVRFAWQTSHRRSLQLPGAERSSSRAQPRNLIGKEGTRAGVDSRACSLLPQTFRPTSLRELRRRPGHAPRSPCSQGWTLRPARSRPPPARALPPQPQHSPRPPLGHARVPGRVLGRGCAPARPRCL